MDDVALLAAQAPWLPPATAAALHRLLARNTRLEDANTRLHRITDDLVTEPCPRCAAEAKEMSA